MLSLIYALSVRIAQVKDRDDFFFVFTILMDWICLLIILFSIVGIE